MDITQLKNLTETVLENNIKYSEILDSLQDIVLEPDIQLKFIIYIAPWKGWLSHVA